MKATVSLDATQFSKQLLQLAQVAKKDVNEILKQQSRLFVRDCIRKTPPASMAQGRAAIRKDLFGGANGDAVRRAVFMVAADWMPQGERTSDVLLFTNKKTGAVVTDKIHFMPNATIKQMQRIHYAAKSPKTGRISQRFTVHAKRGPRYRSIQQAVVKRAAANRYLAHVSRHVGRLKAGWWPAARALGGTAPAWVRRHASGARGSITFSGTFGFTPQITIENHALGVTHAEGIARAALVARNQAMRQQVALIVSGYSKDVKASIIRQRAGS